MPRVLALTGVLLAVLGGGVLVASGLGYRGGLWELGTGFMLLKGGAYGTIAAAVLSLMAIVLGRVKGTKGMKGPAIVGLLVGLPVTAIMLDWNRTAASQPHIHDITTDTVEPPEFVAILPLREGARNPSAYEGAEIAQQQQLAYPDIKPVESSLSTTVAFTKALAAAREMGWDVVAADSEKNRIEATDSTFWFGFKDDVVIRIRPEGRGSRLDVRSLSRVGKGDVGTNAKRVRAYLAVLTKKLGQG